MQAERLTGCASLHTIRLSTRRTQMVDLILELDAEGPMFREAIEYVVAYYIWLEETEIRVTA
jgi:hypothetical protein